MENSASWRRYTSLSDFLEAVATHSNLIVSLSKDEPVAVTASGVFHLFPGFRSYELFLCRKFDVVW